MANAIMKLISNASPTPGAMVTTQNSPAHGGLIIYGRSDAVLNPGGVRIGTAEIYRQVEKLDEVLESIAIGQRWAGRCTGRVVRAAEARRQA